MHKNNRMKANFIYSIISRLIHWINTTVTKRFLCMVSSLIIMTLTKTVRSKRFSLAANFGTKYVNEDMQRGKNPLI